MGPLFYYELVRLARKGRSTLLRCAYALALLAALAYTYHDAFPQQSLIDLHVGRGASAPPRELASLARNVAVAVFWVQYVAVLVLTPSYLADAIAGERERKTLDLLLTTSLLNRDIVLGKLFARLAHVAAILLAGLPVLCITLVWGGVAPSHVISAFAATGLGLLAVGSLCTFFSSTAQRAAEALVLSYLTSFTLCGFCSGIMMVETYPAGLGPRTTPIYFALTVLSAFVVTAVAVTTLRQNGPTPAGHKRAARRAARSPKRPPAKPRSPRPLPPIGDWPLLWKEVYLGSERTSWPRDREWLIMLRLLLMLLVPVVIAAVCSLAARRRTSLDPWDRGAATELTAILALAAAAWCCAAAFNAAGSVSVERERRTLDVLLTLPSARTALLGAKWLGSVVRGRSAGYLFAYFALGSLFSGVLDPVALVLLLISVMAWLAFSTSLGLWLSVACPTRLRAHMLVAVALLLAFLGSGPGYDRSGGAWLQADGSWWHVYSAAIHDVRFNPFNAWWFFAFDWGASDINHWVFVLRMTAVTCSTLIVGLLAVGLWLDTRRRFRREGGAAGG